MVAIRHTNNHHSSQSAVSSSILGCSWLVRTLWPPHKKWMAWTAVTVAFFIYAHLEAEMISGSDPLPSSSQQQQQDQFSLIFSKKAEGTTATEAQQQQQQQQQQPLEKVKVQHHSIINNFKNKNIDNDNYNDDPNAPLKFDHEWKPSIHGEITLVISNFLGETPELLDYLKNGTPDFIHEIILIIHPSTPFSQLMTQYYLQNDATYKKVRVVHRGPAHPNCDLCSVVINTKYFVPINGWQPTLIPHTPLFTQTSNNNFKILAQTKDTFQCQHNPQCSPDLDAAMPFDEDPQAFESTHFLYLTQFRNEYCKRYLPIFKSLKFPTIKFSPTPYMALLKSMGVANKYYKVISHHDYKCRPTLTTTTTTTTALRHGNTDANLNDDSNCETDNNQNDAASSSNTCPLQATKFDCVTLPNCLFRPLYNCPPNPIQKEEKWEHEPIPYRDELIQTVKNAHNYWLDPSSFETNSNAIVPNIPRIPTGPRVVPDKIFACYDYHEHLNVFAYYEGAIFELKNMQKMYYLEEFIREKPYATRDENLEFVQNHATKQSLLLGNSLYLHDCLPDYITDFPGQQLFRNIEPQEYNFLTPNESKLYPLFASKRNLPQPPDPYNYLPPSDKVHLVGRHEDSPTSVQIIYLAFILAGRTYEQLEMLFNPNKKPLGTKEHFLIYAATHFISFREEAASRLASISAIHTVGQCQGTGIGYNAACVPFTDEERPANIQLSPHNVVQANREDDVLGNHELFKHYRFALVMENVNVPGYITEKVYNAFMAGTIPIWYGTRDIFQIFNEKAMIYYDIDNPQEAVDRVAYLEQHPDAYEAMIKEPILARNSNGDVDPQAVIEKWFSIRDEIGNGKIKEKVLDMMGYRDYGGTAVFYSYNDDDE